MICKVCNTNNEPGSKFCISCGSALSSSTKICPNGHVYDSSLPKCPYCPSAEIKQRIGGSASHNSDDTETFASPGSKTNVISGSSGKGNKTVIVGSEGAGSVSTSKSVRKLVGWLVSFSWIPEGEDYRLYEGRNLVSTDSKADIVLSDPAVSTPHCMILFRGGKFLVKDELSTNGTFVNDVSIEETELKDGDLIKVGKTELKFRTVN